MNFIPQKIEEMCLIDTSFLLNNITKIPFIIVGISGSGKTLLSEYLHNTYDVIIDEDYIRNKTFKNAHTYENLNPYTIYTAKSLVNVNQEFISRCLVYYINRDKNKLKEYYINILANEDITDEVSIKKFNLIFDTNYPNIRKINNTLNASLRNIDNKKIIEYDIRNESVVLLYNAIKVGNDRFIYQLINNWNYLTDDNINAFFNLLYSDETINQEKKYLLLKPLADYNFRKNLVSLQKIEFIFFIERIKGIFNGK